MTNYFWLARERHPLFGVGNGLINIGDGARPPATFVMLGGLEFSPRRAQMLKSPPHVGLIGPC